MHCNRFAIRHTCYVDSIHASSPRDRPKAGAALSFSGGLLSQGAMRWNARLPRDSLGGCTGSCFPRKMQYPAIIVVQRVNVKVSQTEIMKGNLLHEEGLTVLLGPTE